jgi:hypothetical protein
LYQLNWPRGFYLFFEPVRFMSAQLALSLHFPLLGATSPPADVVTPPRRVTFPFYWAKISSLLPLHLSATLCLIASPLEQKLKHWICTTAACYPLHTIRLSPSITIKKIISTLTTFPTIQPHLHFTSFLARAPRHQSSTPPQSFSFTTISHSSSLCITIPTVIN